MLLLARREAVREAREKDFGRAEDDAAVVAVDQDLLAFVDAVANGTAR